MAKGYNTLWNGKVDPHQIIHSVLIINEDSFWGNLDVFNPFTPKGFPRWSVKSSDIRQSKIYKCQWHLCREWKSLGSISLPTDK